MVKRGEVLLDPRLLESSQVALTERNMTRFEAVELYTVLVLNEIGGLFMK